MKYSDSSRPAPTNICIVGASGLIGLRHTLHCVSSPLVNLTCIVDPTPAGADLAVRHNVVYYADLDEMLVAQAAGNVLVEGVILATPNATHVPLGIKVVKAGIHILIEKPMSVTIESGRSLISEANNPGCGKILVGHHRRFNTYALEAKKMIDEGKLGRVLAIQGTWTLLKPSSYFSSPTSWRKELASGGTILINLVHELDLLRYFMGDVAKVFCQGGISTRGFEVEETGAVVLSFKNGAVGTFIFSDAVASPCSWEGATGENPNIPFTGGTIYTFFGTHGTTSIPDLKLYHYDKPDGCWTDSMAVQSTTIAPDSKGGEPLLRQLEYFACICKDVCPEVDSIRGCTGIEGLKNIILLETIRESMIQGVPLDVAEV